MSFQYFKVSGKILDITIGENFREKDDAVSYMNKIADAANVFMNAVYSYDEPSPTYVVDDRGIKSTSYEVKIDEEEVFFAHES